MSREEVEKLLGGYATGTLTPEERQSLFEAALEDQALFDALAAEQPLRDLLRDPAAKAEVLAALDGTPARRGWLAWMRRPWVPVLAMAGFAAVGVAVWQANRTHETAAPQVIAKLPAPAPQPLPQQPAAAVEEKQIAPAAEPPKQTVAKVKAAPARRLELDRRGVAVDAAAASAPASSRDAKDAVAPAALPAAPAPAPAPVVAASKPAESQTAGQQAGAQSAQVAVNNQYTLNTQNQQTPSPMNASQFGQNVNVPTEQLQQLNDARSQFYARSGFAPQELRQRAEKKAALAATKPPVLGVRCSIIRSGNQEVDLSTPLSAGETVKLRIRPNADGFLYVREGEKLLTSAAVKNNQQFETPELKNDTAGTRKLEVVFSRVAMFGGVVGGVGGARPANLVENTSGADPGTYIVTAGAVTPQQQIVVPILLVWR
jgi:hypothetical protein